MATVARDVANRVTQPFRAIVDNPIDTLRRFADSGRRLPQTAARLSLALSLHYKIGRKQGKIGAAYALQTNQQLTLDEEYEVNKFSNGLPVTLVPQTLTGRTITLSRYDLYKSTFGQLFGPSDTDEMLNLLTQIPIEVRKEWRVPKTSILDDFFPGQSQVTQVERYVNCYITQVGQTVSAEGELVTGTNATLVWGSVLPFR